MSLFEHFFKVLSFYSEARIRIRIRFQSNKQNSDPHQFDVDPQQFNKQMNPQKVFSIENKIYLCVILEINIKTRYVEIGPGSNYITAGGCNTIKYLYPEIELELCFECQNLKLCKEREGEFLAL